MFNSPEELKEMLDSYRLRALQNLHFVILERSEGSLSTLETECKDSLFHSE